MSGLVFYDCEICGKKHARQKTPTKGVYCSPKCKQKAYRARVKASWEGREMTINVSEMEMRRACVDLLGDSGWLADEIFTELQKQFFGVLRYQFTAIFLIGIEAGATESYHVEWLRRFKEPEAW